MLTHVRAATGRIDRYEVFDPDQLEEARARYRDVTGLRTPVGNTASRLATEIWERVRTGRVEEIAALLAADGRFEDRRPGMGVRLEGVGPQLEQYRVLARMGITAIDVDVRGVRGENLALLASVWKGAFEVSLLTLVRINADGVLDLSINFSMSDLEVAFAELANLDEAPALAPNQAVRLLERSFQATVAGRLDPATLADDIVFEDRRSGLATRLVGAEPVLEMGRLIVRMRVPRVEVVPLAVRGEELGVARVVWGDEAGVEVAVIHLVRTSPGGGPMSLLVCYDQDGVDAAIELLDELYAESVASGDIAAWSNRFRRAFDFAKAGRFDDLAETTSPDYVLIDNRPGLGTRIEGRRAMVDHLRTVVELGVQSVEYEELETRGDRLALLRNRWSGPLFEVEMLLLYGADEERRDALAILYDPADIEAARAELDRRFLAFD
jgi:hypothetical protein